MKKKKAIMIKFSNNKKKQSAKKNISKKKNNSNASAVKKHIEKEVVLSKPEENVSVGINKILPEKHSSNKIKTDNVKKSLSPAKAMDIHKCPCKKYVAIIILVLCICIVIVFIPISIYKSSKSYKEFFPVDVEAKAMGMKYSTDIPSYWGENPDGIVTHFNTDKKEIALTFDGCGGRHGSGADMNLINFLMDNHIKATFFLNARWIMRNKHLFDKIVASKLFDIENHGLYHSPLSVTKKEAYHIPGTNSPGGVVYEVEVGATVIQKLTGRKPLFFRSGTAFYDDVSMKILIDMGYKAMGFSVNADEGATLPAATVYSRLKSVKSGDIVISHLNRPLGHTSEGYIKAIPELKAEGFDFIKLSDAKSLEAVKRSIGKNNKTIKGLMKVPTDHVN